jgi:hypothetical protein
MNYTLERGFKGGRPPATSWATRQADMKANRQASHPTSQANRESEINAYAADTTYTTRKRSAQHGRSQQTAQPGQQTRKQVASLQSRGKGTCLFHSAARCHQRKQASAPKPHKQDARQLPPQQQGDTPAMAILKRFTTGPPLPKERLGSGLKRLYHMWRSLVH